MLKKNKFVFSLLHNIRKKNKLNAYFSKKLVYEMKKKLISFLSEIFIRFYVFIRRIKPDNYYTV